jgi:hypothetical protein
MSDGKNWGSTVLGWFVVQEDGIPGPEAPPDEPLPAVPEPPAFVKEPPSAPGGRVDFAAVYEAAGVEREEQARVTKAAELLAALPGGTDAAVKKQIVEASLNAFGVPIEKIIEGAVQEIQALEAYIRAGAADTQKVHEESEKRITQFTEEIRRIRTVMEARMAEQQAVIAACNGRSRDEGARSPSGRAVARVVTAKPIRPPPR